MSSKLFFSGDGLLGGKTGLAPNLAKTRLRIAEIQDRDRARGITTLRPLRSFPFQRASTIWPGLGPQSRVCTNLPLWLNAMASLSARPGQAAGTISCLKKV